MFIVIEGLDGSGKTTISKLLYDYLTKKNYKVLLTSEPTDGPIGRIIKKYLAKSKHKRDHILEALLFAADRRWHVKEIILPALNKYDYIISDRYVYSSYAYQQSNVTPLKWLIEINKDVPKPDIIIFLDVSPDECLRRLRNKGKSLTILEQYDILINVYNNYMSLIKLFNMMRINAEKQPIRILEDIIQIVDRY